jgi:hypothetical protein
LRMMLILGTDCKRSAPSPAGRGCKAALGLKVTRLAFSCCVPVTVTGERVTVSSGTGSVSAHAWDTAKTIGKISNGGYFMWFLSIIKCHVE